MTEYELGYEDGRARAKHFSPADIRTRLDIGRSIPHDTAYLRGVRAGLQSMLDTTDVRRGQGGTCKGLLTISLSGPKGSGKSMVHKFLQCILPLLPLQRFVVKEIETDD